MSPLDLARLNLLSPPVLAFGIGAAVTLVRGGARFPRWAYTVLSMYLLAAIGVKGGIALAATPAAAIWRPALATLLLGIVTPIAAYVVIRRVGRFAVEDAAAIAAHYGSVSAVTFTAALAFLGALRVPVEGFMPALVAILEIPAIAVALLIARWRAGDGAGLHGAVREILTGRSIATLVAGIAAGIGIGASGVVAVPAGFNLLFVAALTIFLLDMGMTAAGRLREVRAVGSFLAVFAVGAPLVLGVVGAILGRLAGLSVGGTTVFAVMAASASYIAAPAAVRVALPRANPALYLTAALGITFPFNLLVGIPLFHAIAQVVH